MISERELKASYTECAKVCRKSKSTFPWLFRMLPHAQYQAMNAVYAYCRLLDDAVDDGENRAIKLSNLSNITTSLESALKGSNTHSIYPAVVDTIACFQLPREAFEELANGMRFDLEEKTISTEEDLLHYCDMVAGTVGRMVVGVCGVPNGSGDEYAISTGRALQLTNILRDVKEDYVKQKRCYIPETWLNENKITVEDLIKYPAPDSVKSLLITVGGLTEKWYRTADETLPQQYKRELKFAEALRNVYKILFERMRNKKFDTAHRVSLGKWNKVLLVLKYLI